MIVYLKRQVKAVFQELVIAFTNNGSTRMRLQVAIARLITEPGAPMQDNDLRFLRAAAIPTALAV